MTTGPVAVLGNLETSHQYARRFKRRIAVTASRGADCSRRPRSSLVACEARPNTASSLLYYLNARVHWVNAPFDHEYAQRVLGLGRDYYWDEPALLIKWKSSAPIYFIVEESRLPYWQVALTPPPRIVNTNGTRVVLCNR